MCSCCVCRVLSSVCLCYYSAVLYSSCILCIPFSGANYIKYITWGLRAILNSSTLCHVRVQTRQSILGRILKWRVMKVQTAAQLPTSSWDPSSPSLNFQLSACTLHTCLQDQENNLKIYHYIKFRTTCTRTGSTGYMLNINYTRISAARHFYFDHIVLLWNSVQPAMNHSKLLGIKFLWSHFTNHFNPLDTCTYHLVYPCSNCHASGRLTL